VFYTVVFEKFYCSFRDGIKVAKGIDYPHNIKYQILIIFYVLYYSIAATYIDYFVKFVFCWTYGY